MTYKFSIEEKNDVIHKLAEHYPKTFFDNPKLRVPLMKNVTTALQRDGFPIASELIGESVDWYQSHIGYQHQLQAGRKRIDLAGRESGAVTELEERATRKKITEYNEKKLADRNLFDPIKTATALVDAQRIAQDQLRKIDAPSPKIEISTMNRTAAKSPVRPELTRLYEAVLAANMAMSVATGNNDMQVAVTAAALGVVIKEAQRVIDEARSE